jgi:hypothetical protein
MAGAADDQGFAVALGHLLGPLGSFTVFVGRQVFQAPNVMRLNVVT